MGQKFDALLEEAKAKRAEILPRLKPKPKYKNLLVGLIKAMEDYAKEKKKLNNLNTTKEKHTLEYMIGMGYALGVLKDAVHLENKVAISRPHHMFLDADKNCGFPTHTQRSVFNLLDKVHMYIDDKNKKLETIKETIKLKKELHAELKNKAKEPNVLNVLRQNFKY